MSLDPTRKILSLDEIAQMREELAIEENLFIAKALSGTDVNSIMKAQQHLEGIQKRDQADVKSMLVDPLQLASSFGYKDKIATISYDVLRAMAKTHIPKAIRDTRKEQVQTFCVPQKDQYSSGFVIEPKRKSYTALEEKKLSKQQEQRIADIIEFILNCGNTENFWTGDDFSTFTGKIIDDSLTMDQATWENRRDRAGRLVEFFATDGATFRVADAFDTDGEKIQNDRVSLIQGYAPSHVQIYQSNIIQEFYPWELAFGVRNPTTDIRLVGYGRSELEDMIQTVTSILNADLYNSNFFKVGSAPKGILKYSGNISANVVEDFKRQWQSQVSGVMNMHKIPLINADKLDFINTHVPNKDMEWSKYQEFLIKICCALYKIDPSEIGFPMQGSAEAKPMFEGNNEARLKYSKDKGLKPLLKKYESWLNKWVISQLDPTMQLRFVGIEDEKGEKDELDMDIQKGSNFVTINENRKKYNMDPIDGGDIILNPTFTSAKAMAEQSAMGQGDQDMFAGDDQDVDAENNPFMKALELELPNMLSDRQ